MTHLPLDTNLVNPDLIPTLGGPPHQLFDAWRQTDPVHWNPAPGQDAYDPPMPGASLTQGFWTLTRYQDVWDVSRDQVLFTSHDGTPVIWDFDAERLATQQAGMMGMPPAQHTKVKRLVMPPFAPRELAALEPEIKKVAGEIVDAVAGQGHCEFIFDVASKLPVHTFCKLVGIPDTLKERVAELGNAAADIESGYGDGSDELSPVMQLFALALELAEEKRRNPDGYMLSRLVNGDVDGEKLDDMEISMFVVVLSIAGHETTRNTAAHFLRLMNEYPKQYDLLRSDLERYLPNAIDEVLRFSPPVIKFRRTVTQDTVIGDQPVKKGDKIYLSYPAANRDPAVFDNPHVFDITRENANKHLSFGTGPHICLGARLAHMQLKALLTEIVTRIPDIRIDGELTWLRSIWFNGIMKMPVAFTPEPRS